MFMQTGFGGSDENMMENWISAMTDIILPVFEKSVMVAGKYAKGCGRDVIISGDVEYAQKYCAMCTVGQCVGSTMPEIYTDSEQEEAEEVPEEDCPDFVRYSGDDPFLTEVNLAYDLWDTWTPQSPVEEMLKNAINKQNE